MIKEFPLDAGSKAETLVKGIRKRKGLKEEFPKVEDYLDKM